MQINFIPYEKNSILVLSKRNEMTIYEDYQDREVEINYHSVDGDPEVNVPDHYQVDSVVYQDRDITNLIDIENIQQIIYDND